MPYLQLADQKLYYEREGAGPSLVLLGGYTCDRSLWDLVRKELTPHFDLILPDNRGAGRTGISLQSFTVQTMAEDTLHLIEHLSLKRPHILGHSMGGMIAQVLAHKAPGKIGKVILAQTASLINPITAAVLNTDLHVRQKDLPIRLKTEVIMPWLLSPPFMASPAAREAFLTQVENEPLSLSLQGQEQQADALLSFDSRSWISEIKTPCLVCIGDQDLLIPPTDSLAMFRSIPGATLHTFPNMGHMAPLEIPGAFSEMVETFLLA